ncbi:hypothetical protein SDC9_79572 [bioreactor metagenome]|uniref:Uncharacterized protein n=1 Tax=bioreactor metagenome TaxID=1076179 RepID=A0A644YWM5_9ZZZZ
MVLAEALHLDVTDEHHLVVGRIEGSRQNLFGVLVEAREQLRTGPGDTSGRIPQAFPVRVLADTEQELPHGCLHSIRIVANRAIGGSFEGPAGFPLRIGHGFLSVRADGPILDGLPVRRHTDSAAIHRYTGAGSALESGTGESSSWLGQRIRNAVDPRRFRVGQDECGVRERAGRGVRARKLALHLEVGTRIGAGHLDPFLDVVRHVAHANIEHRRQADAEVGEVASQVPTLVVPDVVSGAFSRTVGDRRDDQLELTDQIAVDHLMGDRNAAIRLRRGAFDLDQLQALTDHELVHLGAARRRSTRHAGGRIRRRSRACCGHRGGRLAGTATATLGERPDSDDHDDQHHRSDRDPFAHAALAGRRSRRIRATGRPTSAVARLTSDGRLLAIAVARLSRTGRILSTRTRRVLPSRARWVLPSRAGRILGTRGVLAA